MITRRLTNEELIRLGDITIDWFEEEEKVIEGLLSLNAFVMSIMADQSDRNQYSHGPGDPAINLLAKLNYFMILFMDFTRKIEKDSTA